MLKRQSTQKIAVKKSRKVARILNLDFDSTSKQGVLRFVRYSLGRGSKFFIVTPNPEMVMRGEKDKKFAKTINSADLSLPDGIGVVQAAKFLELPNTENKLFRPFFLFVQGLLVGGATFFNRQWLFAALTPIKGREIFLELMKLANKKGFRVYLLGGERGVSKDVSEKLERSLKKVLERSLKKVKIEYSDGPSINESAKPVSKEDSLIEKDVINSINKFKPHFLFVAFGAPKQEKWLAKWLPELDIGGAMGVGGTFDYLIGRAKLPPPWIENFGLEWVWRLLTQPWRIKRVLIAFPIFPLKVYLYKLFL